MKEEIMKKWVKALRSGEYKRAVTALCRENKNGYCSFCCLGVLIELYIQEKNKILKTKIYWKTSYTGVLEFGGKNGFLPEKVKNWAGMNTNNGVYSYKDTLAKDNDNGKSFKQIADVIEKNYENL